MSTELTSNDDVLVGADFGRQRVHTEMWGDIWTATWGRDGSIYVVQDDSIFRDGSSINLGIARLVGDDPMDLEYQLVNPMLEYSPNGGQTNDERHPRRGSWKAVSIVSVDGVLYASIALCLFYEYYVDGPQNGRVATVDGSIIASFDDGRTWKRSYEGNFERPMFPGGLFSSPSFIQFGRDSTVHRDGSDRCVYALSPDGVWAGGDHLILGRVRRERIGDLDPSDWEFYCGGDGAEVAAWTPDARRAEPVFEESNRVGWVSAAYVPESGRYLLARFHWIPGRHHGEIRWILHEATAPWGPWTPFHTSTRTMFEDYYFPVIVPKFIEQGGTELTLFTAGAATYWNALYRLTVIPLHLHTSRTLVPSTRHLELRAVAGDEDQESEITVGFRRGDGGTLGSLQAVDAPAWLQVDIDQASSEIRLAPHTSGLAPGTYSGEVVIGATDAFPPRTVLTVALRVDEDHTAVEADGTQRGLLVRRYRFGVLPPLTAELATTRPEPGSLLGSEVSLVPRSELREDAEGRLLVFEGYFTAAYDGDHSFYLTSRDGSRLWVADRLLIDNDGVHFPLERSDVIRLQPGLHPLRLEFFQLSGEGHLQLDVRAPGEERRPIQAQDLRHRPDGERTA